MPRSALTPQFAAQQRADVGWRDRTPKRRHAMSESQTPANKLTRLFPARNLKWQEMRVDTTRHPTVSDCAQHCLPSLRACAGLFYGNQSAGDALVETFLTEVLGNAASHEHMHTPAGFARAFEACLRGEFGNIPQRIALTHTPSIATGVWMSVDEFFRTLTCR